MSGHGYKLEVVLHFLRAQGLELVPLWSQAHIGTQMSAFTTGSVVRTCFLVRQGYSHYAQHLTFQIKWSKSAGRVKRWVTIDPEFLKGWRYRDDITLYAILSELYIDRGLL